MGRKWFRLLLPAALMLLLSGCLFRPPDELYKRPEQSAEYDQLASAIKEVRSGLEAEFGVTSEDAVIVSGDNTASIQLQDLDGDGERESAVAFIRIPGQEKSLKIYVFSQVEEDYRVTGLVEGTGSAIYSVDYVDLNGEGKKELVVNWQVSAGVYQLGAYTLDELSPTGRLAKEAAQTGGVQPSVDRSALLATELLLTGCSGASGSGSGSYSSGYQLLDIDQDTRTEIAVVRIDTSGFNGQVEVYGWQDGAVVRLSGAGLSAGAVALNRIQANYLGGDYYPPALYVTCTLADGSKTIDVLACQQAEGQEQMQLVNLSLDPESGVSQNRLIGYTDVELTDINGDYVLEIPSPSPLPAYGESGASNFWLIDWYQYDGTGTGRQVATTYHNKTDGWYLEIPDSWRDKISLSRSDSLSGQREVIFSLWQGEEETPQAFLSVYRLTGSNRTLRAKASQRFILREDAEVIYAAKFYDCDWDCGLNEMDLLDRFHIIEASWYS